MDITHICEKLSRVNFWLPTKERTIVAKVKETELFPTNLVVRLSDPMIGEAKTNYLGIHVSGVMPKYHKPNWQNLVDSNTADLYHCPAPLQGNSCGDCRACWDHTIKRINYLEH